MEQKECGHVSTVMVYETNKHPTQRWFTGATTARGPSRKIGLKRMLLLDEFSVVAGGQESVS